MVCEPSETCKDDSPSCEPDLDETILKDAHDVVTKNDKSVPETPEPIGNTSGEVPVDPAVPLSLEVTTSPGGSIKVGDSTTNLTKCLTEKNTPKAPEGKIKPPPL